MRFNPIKVTRKRLILLGLAALAAAGTGGYCYRRAVDRAALARTYWIAEIVPLPGFNNSQGSAINASGQVTGRMLRNAPAPSFLISHAFLWRNGKAIDLGVAPGFARSSGYGLNNIGQIVGDLEVDVPTPKSSSGGFQSSDPVRRGFQTSFGKMTPLPLLPGFTESEASVINDQGQIAGTAFTEGNHYGRGFLYSNGRLTNLGTLASLRGHRQVGSTARDINRAGQIVGTASASGGFDILFRAFLYSHGKMKDLGTLPGYKDSLAGAINDRGQVTGTAAQDGPGYFGLRRAFLWQSGVMKDLGTLPGYKNSFGGALNYRGEVVGEVEALAPLQYFIRSHLPFLSPPTEPPRHAFLYRSGRMVDLNDLIDAHLGWELETATGINDSEQIVGTGTHNGQERAFVLTPRQPGRP